jgi:hypothetical protein
VKVINAELLSTKKRKESFSEIGAWWRLDVTPVMEKEDLTSAGMKRHVAGLSIRAGRAELSNEGKKPNSRLTSVVKSDHVTKIALQVLKRIETQLRRVQRRRKMYTDKYKRRNVGCD